MKNHASREPLGKVRKELVRRGKNKGGGYDEKEKGGASILAGFVGPQQRFTNVTFPLMEGDFCGRTTELVFGGGSCLAKPRP